MKMILRSTAAAAAISGAMFLVPSVADAGVNVSVGIGMPGVVYAPGPGYAPYEGQYYYDPVYIAGAWYHGPYRWRMRHGERVFWVNGGWRHNEWRGGPIPGSLVFRNGGYYRGGRYEGFHDADRINARFVTDSRRRVDRPVRADMRSDRPNADKPGAGDPRRN